MYADAQVTVLNCYEFINSNGGSTITDSQGREVSTDELRKACETDRDKNLENVEVNGKNVCKGLKSWGAMAWSACVDEVNNSGGNAAETVVVAIDNPTINPDEPGANNNSGNGPGSNASGTTDSTDSTDDARDCMNSGAAATLGWIVCPVLNWLTGAANTIYETFLEPALQVAPQLFTNGGSTYQGWEFFRNLANGLMIILLLFVIFSQVTGVGIDNYGIKKTLPKIIVAAILMNLSYWICIAAVDLSNIIGNGLQQMFIGLAEGITIPPIEIGEGVTAAIQTGTLSTAVTILVAIAGASGAIWALKNNLGGIALLIAVSAISVLVSILTLFIILAARQAAIVVLVVISPLAMACYMLPNTQSLFKKWLKFLQTLLLVYPIAGLLVGGGNYVSTLLLGTGMANNLFGAVTAMITGIIPIFFIPSVLRRSLAFAGDIGNKISGVGRNIGRRTSGAVDRGVKNTEAYKQNQQLAAQRRIDNFSRKKADRLDNKMNRRTSEATRNRIRLLERREGNGSITEVEQTELNTLRRARVNTLSRNEQAQLRKARDNIRAQDHRERENANISDNAFFWAQMRQQRQNDRNARDDQMLYRVDDYEQSLDVKADAERNEKLLNTTEFLHDPNKVASIQAQGETSRENQRGQNRNWSAQDYVEAVRAQNEKKEQDQATAAQAVLLRNRYGRGTMETLMKDWNQAFQDGSADLDAITSAGYSLYGNNFLNAMGRSLYNTEITDGHGSIRNQNIARSMSRLRQYSQDNSSFSNAMSKKNSDVARMINSGGITGSHMNANGNQVLEYGELSHYSRQGVTENKLEDWNTQSTDAWRRAMDNDGVTAETVTAMQQSTDPAIIRGAMSNANTRNLIDSAQANIEAGNKINHGFSNQEVIAHAAQNGRTIVASNHGAIRAERAAMEAAAGSQYRTQRQQQQQNESQAAALAAQKQQQNIQTIADAVTNSQGGPQNPPTPPQGPTNPPSNPPANPPQGQPNPPSNPPSTPPSNPPQGPSTPPSTPSPTPQTVPPSNPPAPQNRPPRGPATPPSNPPQNPPAQPRTPPQNAPQNLPRNPFRTPPRNA